MPYQMVHDFVSPSTWYNHPAYNIESGMAVLSGGAAAASRIGAVSRVLADTSELGPSEAAIKAGIDEPWSQGQKLRYAAIHGNKTPERIIWQRPLDEDPESPTFGKRVPVINPETGTVDPRVWGSPGSSFSRNPLSQWFQKQIDTFHENNPELGSNFPLSPFKKQAFRAGKAQFAASFGEKALSRVDAESLIRKYARLSPAEHEAVHIPGRLMTARDQLAYLEEKGKGLTGFQKRHNDQWIQNTKDAMKYLDDDATITTPPSTVSIPDDSGTMIRTETPAENKVFNLRTAGPFVAKHIAMNPELKGAVKSAARITLNAKQYDRMVAHATRIESEESGFVPSTEWQPVPEGQVIPQGAEIRMDPNAGTTEARWDKPPPSRVANAPTSTMRRSARAALDKLLDGGRPEEATTKLEPPSPTIVHSEGGTYNVARIRDEFPHLQEYFKDAKAVADARGESLRSAGYLAEMREIGRLLGPRSEMLGHGLIPDLKEIDKRLAFARVQTVRDPDLIKKLEDTRDYWRAKMTGGETGDLGSSIPEEGRPDPLFDPELAKHGFYMHEIPEGSRYVDQFVRPWRGGPPKMLPELTHQYMAEMERHGGGDPNVAKVVALQHQEAQRFVMFSRLRKKVVAFAEAHRTPKGIDPDYLMAIHLPSWEGRLGVGFRFPESKMDETAFTDKEQSAMALWYDQIRQKLMGPNAAFEQARNKFGAQFSSPEEMMRNVVPGIGYIDRRLLGGLDEENPLWSALYDPRARKISRAFDAINDGQKAALLYLKPAYIAPNALGNVALALVHQGFLAPRNITVAAKVLRDTDAKTVATLKALSGAGHASVLGDGGGAFKALQHVINKGASFYGKIVDDPIRFSAMVHELHAAGYDTPLKIQKLVHAAEDDVKHGENAEKLRQELLNAGRQANDAMINYERLGPGEQNILRRVVFFYPWVKGSARYTMKAFIDHPTVAYGSSPVSRVGAQWEQKELGDEPTYAEGLIPLEGGKRVINPSSASVTGQTGQLLEMLGNIFSHSPTSNLSALTGLSPSDSLLNTTFTGNTTIPTSPHMPWWHRGLDEAFGGWPLQTLLENASKGFPNRPGRLYPTNSLGQAIDQWAAWAA